MAEQNYNPIRSVDGHAVPCPKTCEWGEEDISSSSAGRTEDTVMDKRRIGTVVKVNLSWENVTLEDAAIILKAFEPEYIRVCYLDAKQGKFITSEFYVGNRSAVLYNSVLGLWKKISFNIIERDGRK